MAKRVVWVLEEAYRQGAPRMVSCHSSRKEANRDADWLRGSHEGTRWVFTVTRFIPEPAAAK